jgi:hypothetical protein
MKSRVIEEVQQFLAAAYFEQNKKYTPTDLPANF